MSRKINQKKEAFLASGGLLRSAGLAVPVAGVSSISNFIHQAHHLPAMQQHPGRVRGPHFCMKLRHYKILHSVPAPVFSACNLVRSPGQNAGAITLKNYAPLENGPQSRLHNFRVGAAGPINLRPVFFSKFYPGNLPRPIYFKKVKFEVIVTSGDCKEARAAMTFAGVVCIRIGGAALRSGKQCDGKPRRPILSRYQNPNFFQYSLSNPTSREGRINRKNRVGVRRLISSVPVITAETGSTRENRQDSGNTPNQLCESSLLQPENFAARFRFSCYPKRSSAATCADYTCFPAGSRRQAPFLSLPAPHDGARHDFPVRRKSASLTQVYSPGRFRAGRRRAQSPMRTVSPGPVFVVSLPKSGSG